MSPVLMTFCALDGLETSNAHKPLSTLNNSPFSLINMASFISAFHDDLKQHPLFTQIQSSIDRFLATSEHATVWVIVSAVAAMVLAATLVRPPLRLLLSFGPSC